MTFFTARRLKKANPNLERRVHVQRRGGVGS